MQYNKAQGNTIKHNGHTILLVPSGNLVFASNADSRWHRNRTLGARSRLQKYTPSSDVGQVRMPLSKLECGEARRRCNMPADEVPASYDTSITVRRACFTPRIVFRLIVDTGAGYCGQWYRDVTEKRRQAKGLFRQLVSSISASNPINTLSTIFSTVRLLGAS